MLPVRNQLLILGDFNCGLAHVAGGTAAGRIPHPTKQRDVDNFTSIVDSMALRALNTWLPRRSHTMQTYQHEHGSTQIDYILTRRAHADFQARQSAPIQFDLTPWRGGSKHKMVTATIPLRPGWRRHVTQAGQLQKIEYSNTSLDQAVRTHSPAVQELQEAVSWRLSQMTCTSPDSLNRILLEACAQVFPKKAVVARTKAWMQACAG